MAGTYKKYTWCTRMGESNCHVSSLGNLGKFLSHYPLFRQGRDNKLHVWTLETSGSDARVGDSATTSELSTPVLSYSMDINALNYCRFSLMLLPSQEPEEIGARALIAVPNLVESHLVSSILHFNDKYSPIFDRQISGNYPLATGSMQPSVKPACLNLRMAAGSILLG